MRALPIVWQRLVSQGQTCPRCSGTVREVEQACERLSKMLLPLDIEPVLETKEIDEQTFQANPAESNRIWIAGKPLEEWLNASVGSSKCCSVCGSSACRTVSLNETTYEVVPEELLVKAGLIAALAMRVRQK